MALLTLIITCPLSLGNIYSSLSINYNYPQTNAVTSFDTLIINNQNIMDGTQVTIFTHGMGNDTSFSDWLPLSDDSDLSLCLPFSISLDNTFYINSYGVVSKLSYDPSERIWSKLDLGFDIDISNHICLVYSGINDTFSYQTNEYLYDRFETAIDPFLYMLYSELGVIPKVNLIGHSRGGIINLLYAINHPTIVSNLISIGTPYSGSQWAQLYIDSPAVLHNLEAKAPSVISSILSTLNSNNLYLHSHNFSLSNNNNNHFLICGCGAKCLNESHSYTGSYTYYNSVYDCKTCNCGYVFLTEHSFNVTWVNGLHRYVCSKCGYTIDRSEHSFTYLPFSATQHKTRCVCGYSAKNDHIFNIDGYCEACLYHGGIL